MGMYTEIFVNVDLKEDTPKEVLNVLETMCNPDWDNVPEHFKDKPDRWLMLFNDGSYYTPLTQCGKLTYDEIGGHWSLIGKGDIKNYESEIQQFFKFIAPWCDDSVDFLGYYRYEEDREPTLVYKSEVSQLRIFK